MVRLKTDGLKLSYLTGNDYFFCCHKWRSISTASSPWLWALFSSDSSKSLYIIRSGFVAHLNRFHSADIVIKTFKLQKLTVFMSSIPLSRQLPETSHFKKGCCLFLNGVFSVNSFTNQIWMDRWPLARVCCLILPAHRVAAIALERYFICNFVCIPVVLRARAVNFYIRLVHPGFLREWTLLRRFARGKNRL